MSNIPTSAIIDATAILTSEEMDNFIKSFAQICATFYLELKDKGVPEEAATSIAASYSQNAGKIG